MMNKLVLVDLILMVVPMMIFVFLLMNFVLNIVKRLKCGVLDLMIPYPEKQLGQILARPSMTKVDVTIIAPYIALKMKNWSMEKNSSIGTWVMFIASNLIIVFLCQKNQIVIWQQQHQGGLIQNLKYLLDRLTNLKKILQVCVSKIVPG